MVTLNVGALPMLFPMGFSVPNTTPGPLEVAVISNDVAAVKSFLENDVFDKADLIGVSNACPLIVTAAELGHEEIVDLLIASKWQLSEGQRDKAMGEALTMAVRGGHGEIVRSLCLARGVDQRGVLGSTALVSAVEKGDLLMLNALLFYGADINTINGCGETPLTLAVRHQNMEILQALLAHDGSLGEGSPRIDLEAIGFGALTAMELAMVMRNFASEAKSLSRDASAAQVKMDRAEEIVHALQFAGAAEAGSSIPQILENAYWRKEKGPDAATIKLLDELKDALDSRRSVLCGRSVTPEQKIRRNNYEFFKAMQTERLERMENSFAFF